jgi:predicted metal-dependent hydrolase
MTVSSSSAADLPLPGWAHVPGETIEADHDALWRAKVLVPSRFCDFVPARHPAFRYGIALNDAGYFWEAQEVLEAVWAAAPQGGRERVLLRALIRIANANMKLRTQKPRAATRQFGEALAEVSALLRRKAATGRGGLADSFPLAALAAHLKAKLAQASLSKADWIALGAKI